MKNLPKKTTFKTLESKINKLDKKQLAKIVGGNGDTPVFIQDESRSFTSIIR